MPGVPLLAAPASAAGAAPAPSGEGDVTPEQFGAVGDGVADDAPAIQRALDAAAARSFGGVVVLQPRTAYRCRSGLVLDASHVSLWGHALLDFTGFPGACLRVNASSVARGEPANNYGRKGMISGALHLRGGGQGTASTGLLFDSDAVATSAQMLVENMGISDCGTGIRFGRHAYNTLLLRCEIFTCDTCVDWPNAEDNGERNTLLGCTLFNSGTAVRMTNPSAGLYLLSCSMDFTRRLYDIAPGTLFATDCHHESSVWEDRPIRCTGDGSVIQLRGGWLLNQANDWKAEHVVEVGAGAGVVLDGVFPHNIALARPSPAVATAWATGKGSCRIRNSHGFELGQMPMRVQAGRTALADPDFAAPDWQDPVWRIADTATPIASRAGAGADNLRLSRTRDPDGATALGVAKAYGTTSAAAFVLMAVPVRGGEQVLAGFELRRSGARPGRDGTVFVNPGWARIDGQDADRLPLITRLQEIASLTVQPPTDRYTAVSAIASRHGRTAPDWATHFVMAIDLVQAHQASFLFRGLWCDTI